MKVTDFNEQNLKLIAADIDNTLVGRTRLITPKTVDVLTRLKKHGVKLATCSGRPLDEVDTLIDKWDCDNNLFDFRIGMNGGELNDRLTNTTQEFFKMEPQHLKEILELMSVFDINPTLYYHGNLLCKRIDDMVLFSIQRTNKKAIIYKDISEMYQEPNAKIMFRMDNSMLDECEAYAKAHPSKYWNVCKTGPQHLEFVDYRINKAYPLKEIAEKYKFNVDNIIAFGDTDNDNEMLEYAGFSVCLINGTETTKAICNDVTEFDAGDDGMALYLEKNILKRLGW